VYTKRIALFIVFLVFAVAIIVLIHEPQTGAVHQADVQSPITTHKRSPVENATPKDLNRYYAVYRNRDVIYLRSLFNEYLAGKLGQTDQNDRAAEFTLLDQWNYSYYKSKFIVLTFNKAAMGGSSFSILFQDSPNRVFNVWVYTTSDGTPELRSFESAGKTEQEMAKIRDFLGQSLDDKEHAM
jgi:hypothetical protein